MLQPLTQLRGRKCVDTRQKQTFALKLHPFGACIDIPTKKLAINNFIALTYLHQQVTWFLIVFKTITYVSQLRKVV